MKKLFIILGFITAVIATILAVTKFYNLAVTPIIIAFISGLVLLYLSKKEKSKTKTIQYIFLLVIISLSLTIYKGVTHTSEINDTLQKDMAKELEKSDDENNKESEEVLSNKGSGQ